MVVFEDGLARKSEYRRFAHSRRHGGDTDWIAEVVAGASPAPRRAGRRRRRGRTPTRLPRPDAAADRPGRASTRPPAGRASSPTRRTCSSSTAARPQVAAAQAVLDELGIDDVALVGLAKRLEEVWLPDEPYPVILPRTSEALYLLQRVRDEAHRFAITYHRQKRSKSMTTSALDGIPGLGETRRKALLPTSARSSGCGRRRRRDRGGAGHRPAHRRADRRGAARRRATPAPAVNVTTGEVLDDVDAEPPADDPQADRGRSSMTGDRPTLTRALDTVVVTGLSGAGRSTAAKCLEDLGYFVVDNLPPELVATMVDLGSRSQGAVTRIAVVMDVRSRAFSSDLRSVIRRPGRARAAPARAVPRGPRRGAGPPLRERPAGPPAAGRRPAGRRHRRRAGAAARAARRGRPGDRHQRPLGARAAAGDREAFTAGGGLDGRPALRATRGLVRLQVRPAGRRRPRRRRPVPAQPALDPRAARADRPGRGGPRLRAGPAGRRGVPRQLHRAPGDHRRRLHPRGQALPDPRGRLHRRQAPSVVMAGQLAERLRAMGVRATRRAPRPRRE